MGTLKRRIIEAEEPKEEPPMDVSGWIPVSERLPSMGQRVIIASAIDKWIDVGARDVIGSYEYWSDDGEELGTPTHWMPLPEPPEVKK